MREALPQVVVHYREKATDNEREIAEWVWKRKSDFIRWPPDGCKNNPEFPGWRRDKEVGFHVFTPEDRQRLRNAGITPDRRSNGPAIGAYLMACQGMVINDCRPLRSDGRHRWSIHHIYDGRFPATEGGVCLRAVKDGQHFTHPAGLVAIHPVADALADEVGYFAWLLRWEAKCRFGYDPNKVFER